MPTAISIDEANRNLIAHTREQVFAELKIMVSTEGFAFNARELTPFLTRPDKLKTRGAVFVDNITAIRNIEASMVPLRKAYDINFQIVVQANGKELDDAKGLEFVEKVCGLINTWFNLPTHFHCGNWFAILNVEPGNSPEKNDDNVWEGAVNCTGILIRNYTS